MIVKMSFKNRLAQAQVYKCKDKVSWTFSCIVSAENNWSNNNDSDNGIPLIPTMQLHYTVLAMTVLVFLHLPLIK